MKDICVIGFSFLSLFLFSPKNYNSFNFAYFSGGKNGLNPSKKNIALLLEENVYDKQYCNLKTYVATKDDWIRRDSKRFYNRGLPIKS